MVSQQSDRSHNHRKVHSTADGPWILLIIIPVEGTDPALDPSSLIALDCLFAGIPMGAHLQSNQHVDPD